MAKITQNQKGGTIIFDEQDWVNGLAPNWKTGSFPNVRGGNQMSTATAMNPFRKYGYPMPGYEAVDATNVNLVTTFLRKGVVKNDTAYIVSNGALIHAYTIGAQALVSSATFPHTITPHGHSSAVANDCVSYVAKVGNVSALRYFYSWSDNTDWDIGTYDFSTTFDDDFMSTAPATPLAAPYLAGGVGYPHPMIVGDDDILYIGDRNFLHAYDGQEASDNDGKFFPAVLTIPNGWVITSMEKVEEGLMIFSYFNNQTFSGTNNFRGQARAWLWNYGNLDVTRSYDLNDNLTSESFTLGNTVGVFTYGRTTDPSNLTKQSKIQLFDGSTFKPEIGFFGDLPCRGGVDVAGGSIRWNSSGIAHVYGSTLLGVKSGLNKIAVGDGTVSGMLASFWDYNDEIVMSSGTTTSGGLNVFNQGATDSLSLFTTAFAEPEFPLYSKGRVTNVTVEFSNIVTTPANSTTMDIRLYDGTETEMVILSGHNQVTNQSEMIINRTLDTSSNPLKSFDALALAVRWNNVGGTASEFFTIKRVTVQYEIININT